MGLEGPVIGPFDEMQGTYLAHLRLYKDGETYELHVDDDYIFVNGIYFADYCLSTKCPKWARGKTTSIKEATEKGWLVPFGQS